MQIKQIIKTGIISIFILVILTGGVYAFLKLKNAEKNYHSDLFSLIPTDSYAIFHVHNTEKCDDDFPKNFLPETNCFNILPSLGKISGNQEIIISYHNAGELISAIVAGKSLEQWESAMVQSNFFSFIPKTEQYKKSTIKIWSTAENKFFCYTFYEGIFIGSYNQNLLCKAIDMFESTESLRNDRSFNTCIDMAGNRAIASMLVRSGNWFSFDISKQQTQYWINGFLSQKYIPSDLYEILPVAPSKNEFNPYMIPLQTSCVFHLNVENIRSYIQKISRDVLFPDSLLTNYLTGDISIAYFSYKNKDSVQISDKVACLSLTDESTFFTNLKNEIYSRKGGYLTKVNSNESDHAIYQSSQDLQLSKLLGNLFKIDNTEFLAIYNQYLLFAQSKESLDFYIKQIEDKNSFENNQLMFLYQKVENENAGFLLIDGSEALQNQLLCKEFIPVYFSKKRNNYNTNKYLIQFYKKDQTIYFSGSFK